MKLVDILARELKVWPEGQLTATSSHVDAEVYFQPHNRGDFYPSTGAEDYLNAEVTHAQWQAAVDALKDEGNHLWIGWDDMEACELCSATRKIEAWNGDGLPPSGILCELRTRPGSWGLAEIKYISPSICVWLWRGELISPEQVDLAREPWLIEFRPIRTPEQIAAEERDREIADLYFTINWNEGRETWPIISSGRKADYAKAIDAGYRKVTP